jgi:hypothetical protein
MRDRWRRLGLAAAGVVTALSMGAAPAGAQGSGHHASSPAGNDISYPQCAKSFPTGQAFGIVGVNDGRAGSLNPCLGPYEGGSAATSELYWAATTSTGAASSAGGSQPLAALYVNTGDPGNTYNGQPVADWPTDNSGGGSDPYGSCTTVSAGLGANSPACAWQYGWDRASQDANQVLVPAAQQLGSPAVSTNPGSYRWWLDVETANTWQSGSSGLQMNVADLQGMLAYFQSLGSPQVGVYSTSSQWDTITGGGQVGTLSGLVDWLPGARDLSGAGANCSLPGFTGPVQVTQWTSKRLDYDFACG